MTMTQYSIKDSVVWLNENTQASWSRSKFYRMRKQKFFTGKYRADKSTEYYTKNALIRGCKKIGVPLTTKAKRNAKRHSS